jgi:hypothetical protein
MQFWILIIALSGESAPRHCLSELSEHILVSIKRTFKKLSDETLGLSAGDEDRKLTGLITSCNLMTR